MRAVETIPARPPPPHRPAAGGGAAAGRLARGSNGRAAAGLLPSAHPPARPAAAVPRRCPNRDGGLAATATTGPYRRHAGRRPPLPDCLCAGAALWDVIGRAACAAGRGDDLPGTVVRRPGGVALNIAGALAGHGRRPGLLAALGEDEDGAALAAAVARAGVATAFLQWRPGATDRYVAIEDSAGLVAAVADTGLLDGLGAGLLAPFGDGRLGTAAEPWAGPLVIDGNLAPRLLAAAAASPLLAAADLRLVAASPAKAGRLAAFAGRARTTLYLNRAEAAALAGRAFGDAAAAARALIAMGFARAIVTDGARLLAEAADAVLRQRVPPAVGVRRVTGAGDAFVAAHLAAEMAGAGPEQALDSALASATRLVAGRDAG